MDPFTHAIVGLGVAGLTGEPLAFGNPIYIGAALGAMAPDIDILAFLKGEVSYIKHHRGITHSIPGLMLISSIISLFLLFFWPAGSFLTYFTWTFIPALSHTLLDMFNSYGVAIFYPFNKNKISLNLLMLTDPWLLSLFILFFLNWRSPQQGAMYSLTALLLYLFVRLYMRKRLEKYLFKKYKLRGIQERAIVMPARFGFASWEFIVEKKYKYVIGKVCYSGCMVKNELMLNKITFNKFIEKALDTKLGQFFREFTPFWHVEYIKKGSSHLVCFKDLRYMAKNNKFMHTASVAFDSQNILCECFFYPFKEENKIKIAV